MCAYVIPHEWNDNDLCFNVLFKSISRSVVNMCDVLIPTQISYAWINKVHLLTYFNCH